MQDLITAKQVFRKYNNMDLRQFVKEFEEFTNQKVPEKAIEQFDFCGLNNTDFVFCDFLMGYELKGFWEQENGMGY